MKIIMTAGGNPCQLAASYLDDDTQSVRVAPADNPIDPVISRARR
jgi:hypothetical protein